MNLKFMKWEDINMPSGSRGGSRGGHGFRGSRSASSRKSRPAYVHRHNVFYPPRRYRLFRRSYRVGSLRYYQMTKMYNWLSVFVFALVLCGVLLFTSNNKINLIKSDQTYYFNMIDTAKEEQYMNAFVTDRIKGEGGKYYITYNLEIFGRDLWREDGYTYSIYTKEEADRIFNTGEILIVVEGLPLLPTTDSINADYKTFSLTDDGSYLAAIKQTRYALIFGSISIIGIIGCSIYYFKLMFSHRVMEESNKANPSTNTDEKKEYCLYCGEVLSKEETKCPQCQAVRWQS